MCFVSLFYAKLFPTISITRTPRCNSANLLTSSSLSTDCCFPVQITKSPRGLGLSVSGGVDSNAAFPGLIRIKRLFPHQVAWSTGMLQQGDILLEANGIPLTGLTNYVRTSNLHKQPHGILLTCVSHYVHPHTVTNHTAISLNLHDFVFNERLRVYRKHWKYFVPHPMWSI